MKNYKKNTLSLFIFTLLSVWANLANAALCTGSGAAASPITDTGEALATCTTEPDLYRIKLYEMGLCTTTPSLTNRATVCKSVVNNPDGSLITVQNGVDTVIPGTFTRPDNGTYTYGYIVIAPEFRITAVKNFGNSKKLKGKTGYGSVCWTLAGTYRDSGNTGSYDGSGALTAIAADTRSTYMAECGSTAGTAAEAVIVQDAFGGAAIGTGAEDGDATATATVDGQTVTAHLTDSDMLADATSSANVTRLVGFTLFPTAVNVTDDTRKFISSFKVSEGSMIGYDGVGAGTDNDGIGDANSLGSVKYIGSGPFAVKITVQ